MLTQVSQSNQSRQASATPVTFSTTASKVAPAVSNSNENNLKTTDSQTTRPTAVTSDRVATPNNYQPTETTQLQTSRVQNVNTQQPVKPVEPQRVSQPVSAVVRPNNLASSTSNGTTNPTMTSDEHQADYHLTTQSGWGNDVQTIVKNPKGYYDVYFLQAPGGAQNHGTTVWEHTTTTDFKNFGPQNTAIGVGKGGNSWYGAATGSVVINQGNIAGVPKGDMVAYFTGYHNVQSIYAAYSDDDGKTFDHVLNNGNPILNYNSNGASQDPNNFRDASVVYWNGKMLMYCAEGNKFGVFSSTNGLNWNHVGDVDAAQFAKGMTFDNSDVPVECPVLRNMTDNQGKSHIVLFYGGKNNAAHQTTGTYYVVGHLDNNGLFVADHNTQRLDLGSDFYAANFDGSDDLGTANASIISLGWIGNWGYTGSGVYANENNHTYPADKGQLSQRLGSYSLPRKLTLNSNGMISDAPLLNTVNSGNAVQCSTDHPSTTNNGDQKQTITETDGNQVYTLYDHENEPADSIYDLHFSTKNGQPYKGRIYIDIWQGADNVRLNFDPTNGWMQCSQYAKELDNDPTGMGASNTYQNGTLGNKKGYSADTNLANASSFDIKVFCDKDSVEFFFSNGQAYTVARFATQNNQDFKVYTQDPTDNNQLSVQKLTISNNQAATPSQPAKNQGSNSKPASGTSANNKPTGTAGTPSRGSSSSSKPTTSNKPANSNNGSANKPSTGTSSAKPANGTNKPNAGTSKPASGTNTKPAGTTTNKPSAGTSSTKPANGTNQPAAGTNKPTNSENHQPASGNGSSQTKPVTNSSSTDTPRKPASTNSGSSSSKQPTGKPAVNTDNGSNSMKPSQSPVSGNPSSNNKPLNSNTGNIVQPATSGSVSNQSAESSSQNASQGMISGKNNSTSVGSDNNGTNNSVSNDKTHGSSTQPATGQRSHATATKQVGGATPHAVNQPNLNNGQSESNSKAGQQVVGSNTTANKQDASGSNLMNKAVEGRMQAQSQEQETNIPGVVSTENMDHERVVEDASNSASAPAQGNAPIANSSKISSTNALPETGMSNEGIEFAAAMLALAGIAMVKREHEE